jgi:DNA-binding transcriptional ArsR family regulator
MGTMDQPEGPQPRRAPTASEARALGHPTRLRIVFECRAQALTNKELATKLGTTPGTIHYHLRQLMAEGFLRAEEPRPGPRGSREQPYRATGKSWEIGMAPGGVTALRAAGVEELLAAPEQDLLRLTRLGLTLPRDELDDVLRRIELILEEAKNASRDGEPGLEDVTIFLGAHRRQSGRDHGTHD